MTFYTNSKFMTWLEGQAPYHELVFRLALKDHIRNPGVGRVWARRIEELDTQLIKTADDRAELLTAVKRAADRLTAIVEEGKGE